MKINYFYKFMIHHGKTDWLHLIMFSIISLLAGGWLIYYINDSSETDNAPRYYLYKVVLDETKNQMPISDPNSGYGRVTVKGKVTGTDAMSAAISNYLQIESEYFQEYAGKFVEATGYITEFKPEEAHWSPFKLDIETIEPSAENNINDAGKECSSSLECRYQCALDMPEYYKACPGAIDGQPATFCLGINGKCSKTDLTAEECGKYWEVNGSGSHRLGSCADQI